MAVGYEGRMCLLEALAEIGVALNTYFFLFERREREKREKREREKREKREEREREGEM